MQYDGRPQNDADLLELKSSSRQNERYNQVVH